MLKGNRLVAMVSSTFFVTVGVAMMTAIIAVLHLDISVANVSMLYLLVVIGAALTRGRSAAILASLESFLAFDWFFVKPHHNLTVTDPAEWLALCMFLTTATVTGQLMVLLVNRVEEREKSRRETEALAEASLSVTSQLDLHKALDSVLAQLAKAVELNFAEFIVFSDDGEIVVQKIFSTDIALAQTEYKADPRAIAYVCEKKTALGLGLGAIFGPATGANLGNDLATDLTTGSERSTELETALSPPSSLEKGLPGGALYQPISVEDRLLGVLHLQAKTNELQEGEQRVILSLSNLAGIIIQRDRLIKIEAQTDAVVKTERLKSALLSMVSHDFRSPLTAIKTSVNSLLSDGQPISVDRQRSLLLQVDHETERLNRLIDNILDLSCLEAGMLSLKLEETPLAELVENALNSLSESENDRIVVKLAGGLDEVNVDCVLMAQVLRNLLENALKYSAPDASVELETFAEGNNFFIEVKDRGSGLLASEAALVFTPFFRGSAVKETSIPGMGLGLALSKGLVEAHKGTLSAYNRDAGGTVFRIMLPLTSQAPE